jgi:arsenate reductase (glutaredoxin)
MSDVVVWGIPSCSTVKKARAFLDDNGVVHRFADLRATPPSPEAIARWVSTFGNKAMRNTAGASYRALPNDKDAWDDAQWIASFSADPMLIKRPIIEKDGAPIAVGFKADELERALA